MHESQAPNAGTHEALIEAAEAGMRLDHFLTRRFAAGGFTRSGIQKLIADGAVILNGRKSKPGARLKAGDRIIMAAPPVVDTALVAEPIALEILYEDADCIVINKAPGMVVHPAAGWSAGTLVNALLHHCPDLPGIGGERRPGIVHRLDKDTSGVMVVAKHDAAFHRLASDFKARRVEKEYIALVWGVMPKVEGAIDRPIGRHRSQRKKMSSVRALARVREALTNWRVQEVFPSGAAGGRFAHISLLCLRPHSGRTHQLRVHLADEGYPIVGDQLYGLPPATLARHGVDATLAGFPRQALHAARLRFSHPSTGAAMEFSAPPPADMRQLLLKLGELRAAGDRAKKKRG
ncbi:MAG TPA: RluA family pseudouridine synthase [Candidatus Binatia bacterium]|jgi:23S rRNA pseudouridine1911/1915/1917 synthase